MRWDHSFLPFLNTYIHIDKYYEQQISLTLCSSSLTQTKTFLLHPFLWSCFGLFYAKQANLNNESRVI